MTQKWGASDGTKGSQQGHDGDEPTRHAALRGVKLALGRCSTTAFFDVLVSCHGLLKGWRQAGK